jgi:hypothetical protein
MRTVLRLAAVAAALQTCQPAIAGGYGHYSYGYSSYSYPSYSYYSAPTYYAPPVTYVEKPVYYERTRYVEKPVYIATYAPLLVNVPTYSAGYAPAPPCQQPAQQYVNQPQQQQHFPTTAAPQTCPHTPPAPAAPAPATPAPCEKAMVEYKSQLDELKKDLVALRSTLSRPAPREAETTPGESRGEGQRDERQPFRGAAPRLQSALEVFTYKCSQCHSDKTAATEGDKFVLLRTRKDAKEGENPYELADLTKKQWDKVVELTQSQKMPRKPRGVSDSTFDRLGRLVQSDFDLIVEAADRARNAKGDRAR